MEQNLPATIDSYAENLQQKIHFCGLMHKSGMVPQTYKTPESILIAVLFGRELGFSPIRSLHSISVIQGTPTINAQAMKALAISKGGQFHTKQWDYTRCVLEGIRGDWRETVEYTMQDAEKAQLAGKDNWKKNPKAMLYARAVSVLCRNMWGDVLGGMYSTEELIDEKQESPEVEKAIVNSLTEAELNKITANKSILPDANVSVEWYTYKYIYDLPEKIAGKNMMQVKAMLKANGFKQNPDDNFWYGNKRVKEFAEYLQPGSHVEKPDVVMPPVVEGEPMFTDDMLA